MAPMAESRRNRPNRPPKASAPVTGSVSVDDETAAALALFNSRLVKQAEEERAAKRVEKANRAKDAAAGRVRALEKDTKATAEERAQAAEEYRRAVEALDRAKKGEPDDAAPSGQDDVASSGEPDDVAPSGQDEVAVQPEDDIAGDDTTEAAASSDH